MSENEEKSAVRVGLFEWLTNTVLEQEQCGKAGGVLKLSIIEKDDKTQTFVRHFPLRSLSDGEQTVSTANILAERIEQEADSQSTGRGGGKWRFMLVALRAGEKHVWATHFFTVSLEGAIDIPSETADQRGVLAMLMRQNEMLVQAHTQSHKPMQDTVKLLYQLLEVRLKFDLELFQMMQANVENRAGREAEAFSIATRAKDWSELVGMIKPFVTPEGFQVIRAMLESGKQDGGGQSAQNGSAKGRGGDSGSAGSTDPFDVFK